MPHFPDSLTLDDAKALRKKLALEHHPDLIRDGGAMMATINREYDLFKLRKERPVLGVAAPAPGADPLTWFAAMKAAARAAVAATPDELRRSAAQAQAHVAQPPLASVPSPPPAPAYTPYPPSTSSGAASPTPPTSSGAASPTPQVRRVAIPSPTPRQPASHRIAAKEEADYRAARWSPKDKYETRRYGDVVIFWEDLSYDQVECVAILTASNPRHEVRRNGNVVHTEPATRKWQMERKAVIERAKRMVAWPT